MFTTISDENLSSITGGCACSQQQQQPGEDPSGGDPQQQQQQQQMQQPQPGTAGDAGGQAGSPCQQLITAIMGLINQFSSQSGAQR